MMAQYIYFPFTHISEQQTETVSAFFPEIRYLPLQPEKNDLPHVKKAVEAGEIKRIQLPEQALDAAKQKTLQYTQWAKIHKGNERNLRAILKDNAYFTSDTHVTAIKSQIRGNHINQADSTQTLEKDLLFLSMAQMCDEQNEQIDLELKTIEKNREKLFSALRGSEESAEDIEQDLSFTQTDTGQTMTQERIASWAGCLALAGDVDDGRQTRFFVTTSPAVMDYLESNCTDVTNALDIDQIKVHENNCRRKKEWQHLFCETLMRAVHGEGIRKKDLPQVTDTCVRSGRVKLCVFSGDFINGVLKISGKQMVVCLVNLK